jgi:hypothetical protein
MGEKGREEGREKRDMVLLVINGFVSKVEW